MWVHGSEPPPVPQPQTGAGHTANFPDVSALVRSTNPNRAGKVWCIRLGKGGGACAGTASLFPGAHVSVDGHTVVGGIAEFLFAYLGADIVR